MDDQVKPEAFFDSLSLAHKLDSFLDGFKLEELHLFSYFSSLLYLYDGKSIATWEHKYIVSEGYPFSDSLNEAIKRHIQNGLYELRGEFYTITGRGTDTFMKLKNMHAFISREAYINAACTTSILLPYVQTRNALLSEPEIRKAVELNNASWLDREGVYEQFKKISEAVGVEAKNLIIPAVTWVDYLIQKEKIK